MNSTINLQEKLNKAIVSNNNKLTKIVTSHFSYLQKKITSNNLLKMSITYKSYHSDGILRNSINKITIEFYNRRHFTAQHLEIVKPKIELIQSLENMTISLEHDKITVAIIDVDDYSYAWFNSFLNETESNLVYDFIDFLNHNSNTFQIRELE